MDRDQVLYDRNCAFFAREYPNIFQKLAAIGTPASTLVGSAEGGDLNIDLGHTLFYDTDAVIFAERQMAEFRRVPGQFFMNPPNRYDPPMFVHERVSEAMYDYLDGRELPKLPLGDAHDAGYLLVFGLGLGFHIAPLLERCDVRYIIIMEEFLEFLDHSFWFQDWEDIHTRAAARDTRFFFLFGDDPDQLHSRMHWFMRGEGFGLIDGSYIFRHYRSMMLDAVYAQFRKELPLLPVSIGFWEDENMMIRNCSHNLINHDSYLLDTTPRLERDVPAFIVGSGPSIDGSIEIIRANRDKAVVFSCGTGLSTLLSHGITPDFHCELENVVSSYAHLQLLRDRYGPLDKITLIASNTVWPGMLALFGPSILFFRDSVVSTSLWSPDKTGIYGASPTVTNVGIRSSLLLGFRQLYLFGVDLGTRDTAKRHSARSVYETDTDWADTHEDRQRQWTIEMPANFGGRAYTNDILQWARMLMIHSLDPFPTAKIFNCSDGVKITGTIPKLPRTVKLDTAPGRPRRVVDQIKASLPFFKAPELIAAIPTAEVIAEFDSWGDQVEAIIGRARAENKSFTAFYAEIVPLLRPAGARKFQLTIRAYFVGTLMMMFQIGYFFWHRTEEDRQAEMMRAYLDALLEKFWYIRTQTREQLEYVDFRLARQIRLPDSRRGATMPSFITERIKAAKAGNGPSAWSVLDRLVTELSRRFAARRDIDLAKRFLADTWTAPRFWLYGAGSHSAALLMHFGATWQGRVAGIVDRDPAGRTEVAGCPILPIDAAVVASDLPILVAHPFYETEMAEGLTAAGVYPARIHHLYTAPDFIARSRASLPDYGAPVRAVILGSSRYTTVADSELAAALDPATTRYLAFDLFEATEAKPPFTVIPMDKSIDAVVAGLKALRPKLVYVRTKIETDFLVYVVRQVLPDCVIVHEVWDFSVVFEDDTLKNWLKLPEILIESSRLAECWTVRDGQLVISKWGGAEWNTLFDDVYGTDLYYGGIAETPKAIAHRTGTGVPRILYAGLLPKPEDLGAMEYDYNFLDRLERLARNGTAEITILNSGHEGPEMDAFYRGYEIRFAETGIRYHRRVSYAALMEIAADHDLGWLALDQRETWGMGKNWIMPMRFTGYIQAGLPVIVSPPWGLCVDLVEKFGAGIVLAGDSDAEVTAALARANLAAMRNGSRDLHAHMLASNRRILRHISALIAGEKRAIGGTYIIG
jgi:hypothetical protein